MHSVLDEIPGIGPERRKALMRHFNSIDEIRSATKEQLMEVPEIPENIAERMIAFFVEKDKEI